jgi:hypothetical protein
VRTDGVDPAPFIAVSEQTWCWPVAIGKRCEPSQQIA